MYGWVMQFKKNVTWRMNSFNFFTSFTQIIVATIPENNSNIFIRASGKNNSCPVLSNILLSLSLSTS